MADEYTEGGSKVYRYEAKEPEWNPPTFGKEGSLALTDKFDDNHIDELVDLNRKNTCKRSFFSRFRS